MENNIEFPVFVFLVQDVRLSQKKLLWPIFSLIRFQSRLHGFNRHRSSSVFSKHVKEQSQVSYTFEYSLMVMNQCHLLGRQTKFQRFIFEVKVSQIRCIIFLGTELCCWSLSKTSWISSAIMSKFRFWLHSINLIPLEYLGLALECYSTERYFHCLIPDVRVFHIRRSSVFFFLCVYSLEFIELFFYSILGVVQLCSDRCIPDRTPIFFSSIAIRDELMPT